jgi:hypothetical protein
MAIDADQWALDFDLPACVLLFDTTSTAAMTLRFPAARVTAMRDEGRQMSTIDGRWGANEPVRRNVADVGRGVLHHPA